MGQTRSGRVYGTVAATMASMAYQRYKKPNAPLKRKYTIPRAPVGMLGGRRPPAPVYLRRPKVKPRRSAASRKRVVDNYSHENTSRALTVRGKQQDIGKMLMSILQPVYYRVEGLTQYDTAFGFYPLAFRTDATGFVGLPVHAWDICSMPNYVGGVLTNTTVGNYLVRTTNSAGADAGTLALRSFNSAAVIQSGNSWATENYTNAASQNSPVPSRKAYHCWTSIKLNLYGVRKRSTKFIIELVQIKDRTADIMEAADSNRNKQKLFDYWARPLIYSNINSSDPLSVRMIKVVKSYTVTVDAIQTTEYGGSTSTPHMHTLNWFVRHSRTRKFDWSVGSDPGTSNS